MFVDRLNDFYNASGEPDLTERIARLMAQSAAPAPTLLDVMRATAIGRAATSLRARLATREHAPAPTDVPTETAAGAKAAPPSREPDQVVAGVIRRVQGNKRRVEAAAEAFDVATAFVWQPVPTYKYDARDPDADFGPHARSAPGYAAMADDEAVASALTVSLGDC